MNKGELLTAIRAKRGEFAVLCDGLTDEQLMALPGPQDDWSAKDLMAHLAYWEQRTLDELRVGLGGGTVIWGSDTDKVNTLVLLDSQKRSLDDVRGQFERMMGEVTAFVESLPDDLYTAHFDWLEGRTVWQQIVYEFIEHYDDHMDDARGWRSRLLAAEAAGE
jgi:hypothetical protein